MASFQRVSRGFPARIRATLVVGLIAAVGVAALAEGQRLPGAPKCPVFPRSSHWNQRVDQLPVHPNSDAIVSSVGVEANLHPDFGSGLYEGRPFGIPYGTVPKNQRRVPVSFETADESDRGPYPIPPNVPIEGGPDADGDRHVVIVDRRRCKLYELFAAYPDGGGARWRAGSGAIWNLRSNRLRPAGWTSADAAGLPILPGLARYYEVKRGRIDHALRVTAPRSRREYIYPARHVASNSTDPDLPAMGQRFRLKAGYDTSGFPHQARIILEGLKRYGMIMSDHGSPWYISGAPHGGWSNDELNTLKQVPGSAFEVVDTGALPRPRR